MVFYIAVRPHFHGWEFADAVAHFVDWISALDTDSVAALDQGWPSGAANSSKPRTSSPRFTCKPRLPTPVSRHPSSSSPTASGTTAPSAPCSQARARAPEPVIPTSLGAVAAGVVGAPPPTPAIRTPPNVPVSAGSRVWCRALMNRASRAATGSAGVGSGHSTNPTAASPPPPAPTSTPRGIFTPLTPSPPARHSSIPRRRPDRDWPTPRPAASPHGSPPPRRSGGRRR